MRRAISVQPEWLGRVPTDRRLPVGRVLYTGCGTSFHAAQTGAEDHATDQDEMLHGRAPAGWPADDAAAVPGARGLARNANIAL